MMLQLEWTINGPDFLVSPAALVRRRACTNLQMQKNRPFVNRKSTFFRGNSPIISAFSVGKLTQNWHLCYLSLVQNVIRAGAEVADRDVLHIDHPPQEILWRSRF